MSYAGIFTDKNNIDHPITSTLYGTCSTAAATAAKEVVCSNVDSLEAGMTLRMVFSNANTASSPTINVNGKGAKNVYRFGTTTPIGGNSWEAGAVVELFYDGTSFFMINSDNLGTAAAKNVPASGDASATEVVMGNDSRLSDSRTPTSHTHTLSDITNANLKQDKTDNNLETTSKTVVGAVNELKSGLTNLDVALSVPEGTGKNVLPLTIDSLKKSNTTGTWAGNVYTVGYNTYTVSVDDNRVVTYIEGTSTNVDSSAIRLDFDLKAGSYILSSGFEELFGANDTFLQKDGVTIARGNNSSPGQNFTLSEDSELTWFFRVTNITKVSHPMIRPATITDSTFAPYIPSVESRIEAIESGDYKVIAYVTGDGVKTVAQLLPDLFSSVPSYTKRCSLIYGKAVLPMAEKTTNNAKFGNVSNYQGTTFFLSVNMQQGTAYLTEVSIASNGTITVTDRSTEVPTNGAVISLVQ